VLSAVNAAIRHGVEHQWRHQDTVDEVNRFLARHPALVDDYRQWMQYLKNSTSVSNRQFNFAYKLSSVIAHRQNITRDHDLL